MSKEKVPSKSIRFTVDLEKDQYDFLKKFSEEQGITSSIVLRALLYILETDEEIALRIVDEFGSDEVKK